MKEAHEGKNVPPRNWRLSAATCAWSARWTRPQKKYHIVTLGCQMNVRDSETIAGMLEEMGMRPSPKPSEDADLVLYNTCCVRENAENRALGNVIWLKELKKSSRSC